MTDIVSKPPKGRPYPKGKSGNPRGRPKGSRNFSGLLREALQESAQQGDSSPTKLEVLVRQLVDAALAGDPRITQVLLKELHRLEPAKPDENHDCLESIRALMDGAKERVRAKLDKLRIEHDRSIANGICPTCDQPWPTAAHAAL